MLALMASRNAKETMLLVQNDQECFSYFRSYIQVLTEHTQWPHFSWSPFAFCGPQLSATAKSPTRTVGFLGFGRIAHATLARLIPFGVTHCLYSSNPSSPLNSSRDAALKERHKLNSIKRVDLDDLARESDVLFILAPGGKDTRHIIDEDFLKKMRKTSILVNSGRGTSVDSHALAKALREGWIWGAGIDVIEGEPNIGSDHPLVKEPRSVSDRCCFFFLCQCMAHFLD
jgi:glyoxylate/hydroxypyruvate reductase